MIKTISEKGFDDGIPISPPPLSEVLDKEKKRLKSSE